MIKSQKGAGAAKTVSLYGLLTAMALVLSALESALPPLPFAVVGVRLGLSNIVTMYMAAETGLVPALLIALVKSGFVALIRGPMPFLLSFAGGAVSTFIMWGAFRTKAFGAVGVGVAGSVAHNLAQLFTAMLIYGAVLMNMLPAIILFSIVTGFVTGLTLYFILPALQRIEVRG